MEVRLAIDTNAYTALCLGSKETAELIETAGEVLVPFIVLAELHAGFSHGKKAAENEARLRHFLRKPDVEVLFADEQTIHFYALTFKHLKSAGTPIPSNDLWIAALVQQHRCALHTLDEHFSKVPMVRVV